MPERAAKTGLIARQEGIPVGASVAIPAEFGRRTGFYTFALPRERAASLVPLAAAAAGLIACAIMMVGGRGASEAPAEPSFVVARAVPALPAVGVVPEAPVPAPTASASVPAFVSAPSPVATLPARDGATSPEVRPIREETARVAPPVERVPHAPEAQVGFAGVWAPNDSACSPRANRGNYLPAVIDAQGAFAGETSCAFRNAKATHGGWTVSAACASPKGRWSTQVRLVVSGNRLTWSSPRGTQTYVRCGSMLRRA